MTHKAYYEVKYTYIWIRKINYMHVWMYICVFWEQSGYHFYFPFLILVGSMDPMAIYLLPPYLYYTVSFFVWGITMWNTILINKTYWEPSNNDDDEVLSGRKRNPYSECMLILIRINYCPFHNEIGIKESTQHQVDCRPHDRSCL